MEPTDSCHPIHSAPLGLKRSSILFSLLILLFVASCDLLHESTPPGHTNPIDPSNQNYEPPKAAIVAGPTQNETVTSDTVRFQWVGNLPDSLMQFNCQVDYYPWSGWTSSTETTYTYFDEGVHTFSLKSRYLTGDEQKSPVSVQFTVDAVQGPALMFVPRKTLAATDSLFESEITVEEATNFAGARVQIQYDISVFAVDTVIAYEDSRNILLKNGGTLIDFLQVDRNNGTISLDMAVAGANPGDVSGTGPLGRVRFRVLATAPQTAGFGFTSLSGLRTSGNVTVPMNALVSEVVVIK